MDSLLYGQAVQLLAALRKAMAASRAMADDSALHTALLKLDNFTKQPIQPAAPIPVLLDPFLECLKSHEMSGSLVLIIVDSLRKAIDNGALDEAHFQSTSDRCDFMMQLAKALHGTRFEATDTSTDEVALFELLELIKIITENGRCEISDGAMVMCFETMLSLVIPRFSELLRRTAEDAIVGLTRSVFKQYGGLKREHEESCHINIPGRKGSEGGGAKEGSILEVESISSPSASHPSPIMPAISKPYSKAICDALVGFVGKILETLDKKQTERLIPVAIRMGSAMFEVAGTELFSDPMTMARLNDGMLKEIIRQFGHLSGPNGDALNSLSLFVFGNNRQRLHGQFVFFISHLVSLAKGRALVGQTVTSPNKPSPLLKTPLQRDVVLDVLLFMSKDSCFLSDLYGLYECDPLYTFSIEELASCLAEQTGKSVDRLVCKKAVQCIANFLQHLAKGCRVLKTSNDGTGKHLHDKRSLKMLYARAAEVFNKSPKEIEAFLVEQGLLPAEHSREDLAKQVRKMLGVSKKQLGQWLGKLGNDDLARAFIADLDFRGKRIDDALRLMLATFRLPGESQEINRIMEAFAPVLYEQCSSDPHMKNIFADVDAVYVMAYSVIMLNTDQHNPQYKGRRMTVDDFIKNNRGNNAGSDYDHDFLRQIYRSIKSNEILMPEEHEGDPAFNYKYSEIVNVSSLHYPGERLSVEMSLVAGEILPMVWDVFLRALSELFDYNSIVGEQRYAQIAIGGLESMATSASALNLPDRLDELVLSVWTASSMERYFRSSNGNMVARYLAKSDNGRELVRLLVDIFKLHGEVVRTGWKQLVELIFILHESRVISSESFAPNNTNQDNVAATALSLASSPSSATHQQQQLAKKRVMNDSLLSSLTNYLYSSEPYSPAAIASAPLTPVEAESVGKVSAFLSNTCNLQEIFQETRLLSEESLSCMLSAFLTIVSPVVQSNWTRATKALSIDIVIYCSLQNRDRLCTVWTAIFPGLSEVSLRGTDEVLREHAVIGLGRIALKMAEKEDNGEMRTQLLQFLQLLCNLPQDAFNRISEPILAILLKIVELDNMRANGGGRLLSGSDVWPPYFTIMSLVSRHRQCAPYTLGLLMAATNEHCQPLFPLEFFSEYLDLLSSFISATPQFGHQTDTQSVSPQDMAKTAVKQLVDLEAVMRQKQHDHLPNAFADYVVPIHSTIAMQCCHPSRDIRLHSLVSLQRMIMGSSGGRPHTSPEIVSEFDVVLFTLLDELQSDTVARLHNGTIEDTQMGAASLASKVFLNNVDLLQHGDPQQLSRILLTLLSKLLGFVKFRSETLREGIPETVKNVLFVLITNGNSDGRLLLSDKEWDDIWMLTEQVLPDLKRELFAQDSIGSVDATGKGDEDKQADNHTLNNIVADSTEQNSTANGISVIPPIASPSAIHYV